MKLWTLPSPTRCGGCGKRTDRFYDKRWRRVHDLGCGNREVYLDLEMRRVNCIPSASSKKREEP